MSTIASQLIVGGSRQSREDFLNKSLSKTYKVIDDSKNPDIVHLTVDEPHIGIEKIRDFQKQLSIGPSQEKIKTGIISQAQLLTIESQNALLKTLEEPPANVAIFIMCPTENDLIPTIISRCQIHVLSIENSNLTEEEMEKVKIEFEKLTMGNLAEKLNLTSQIAKDRENANSWLNKFLIFTHQSLFSNSLVLPNLSNLSAIFEAKKRLNANANVRLTIENLFINW